MTIFAAVSTEIFGAASLGIVGVGLAWLKWLSNTQTKTFKSLLKETTERLDTVEIENRGLRVSQRWCDHRFAETLRALTLRQHNLEVPPEFYQDQPPQGGWPRIPPPDPEELFKEFKPR